MTGTDSTTSEAAKDLDRNMVCMCPYCKLLRFGDCIDEPTPIQRLEIIQRLAQRREPEDMDALERARAWENEPNKQREEERIVSTREYQMMLRVGEVRRAKKQAEQRPTQPPPVPSDVPAGVNYARAESKALQSAQEAGRRLGRSYLPATLQALLSGGGALGGKVNAPETPESLRSQQQSRTIDTPFGKLTIVAMDSGFEVTYPKGSPTPTMEQVRAAFGKPTTDVSAPTPEPEPTGESSAVEAYEQQMEAAIARLGELLAEDEEMDQHDREVAILRLAEIRLLWKARF